MRAVWFWVGSFASTEAPYSTSLLTASTLPVFAHVISGVSPVAIAVFGFAPDFRSRRTNGALALVQAWESGVIPKSFATLASAPARSRRSAVSKSFQWAAQSRAVDPSVDLVLTSAF